MKKRFKDNQLIIGKTYLFIYVDNMTRYKFMGVAGCNLKFISEERGEVKFSYNPSDYCTEYWELVETPFKFGK